MTSSPGFRPAAAHHRMRVLRSASPETDRLSFLRDRAERRVSCHRAHLADLAYFQEPELLHVDLHRCFVRDIRKTLFR